MSLNTWTYSSVLWQTDITECVSAKILKFWPFTWGINWRTYCSILKDCYGRYSKQFHCDLSKFSGVSDDQAEKWEIGNHGIHVQLDTDWYLYGLHGDTILGDRHVSAATLDLQRREYWALWTNSIVYAYIGRCMLLLPKKERSSDAQLAHKKLRVCGSGHHC